MTTTAKNTNAARITVLEEKMDKVLALLENQAATKPAKKAGKKTTSKSNKKTSTKNTTPKVHWEEVKAKNGNGKVVWLKFDKPCNNEQYCHLKALDPETFKPLKNKKSLWTWSNTYHGYHAISSEIALKQAKWFENNYIPATDEEMAKRNAFFAKAK